MPAFFDAFYGKNKRAFFRWVNAGKNWVSSWSVRHAKIFKWSGLGGKNRLDAKGHVQWNRKGRW